MLRFKIKTWEKVFIFFSTVLFSSSCFIYVTNIPIRKYFFTSLDEDKQIIVGNTNKIAGTVKRQLSGGTEFNKIESDTPLYNEDLIVTDTDSTATLSFLDGSNAKLGPSTMVRLSFKSDIFLGSISRQQQRKLEVVAGKVTGEAGKEELIISGQEGSVLIQPNSTETVFIHDNPIQPRIPIPASHAPISNPNLLSSYTAPKPSGASKPIVAAPPPPPVRIAPERIERLVFDPTHPTLEKQVELKWAMNRAEVKSVLTFWNTTQSKDEKIGRKLVSEKSLTAHGALTSTTLTMDHPGRYEWEINGEKGEVAATPDFTRGSIILEPEFEGIQLLEPWVAGVNLTSNKFNGDLLTDFDITLRWKEFPTAKQYKVRFLTSESAKKVLLERRTDQPNFVFNKNKIFAGELYYQIFSKLENGFVAKSTLQKFTFQFLPPIQVFPENNAVVSRDDLKKEGNRLLFTWQKTNFTQAYEIEVARDLNFKEILMKKASKENYFLMSAPATGTYWWRVRSINKELASAMGKPFVLTVKP